MIETDDIYRALRSTLETNFEEIPVQIKDIKNPGPPCFYIKYVNDNTKQTATEYINDSYVFNVIYFSAVLTLQDLINVEKELKKVFQKPLKITDGEENVLYNEIDDIDITFNEDDYILNCVLNISVDNHTGEINRYDEYQNDELMDYLEI